MLCLYQEEHTVKTLNVTTIAAQTTVRIWANPQTLHGTPNKTRQVWYEFVPYNSEDNLVPTGKCTCCLPNGAIMLPPKPHRYQIN